MLCSASLLKQRALCPLSNLKMQAGVEEPRAAPSSLPVGDLCGVQLHSLSLAFPAGDAL